MAILEYAEAAARAWRRVTIKEQAKIKKYFHLRPTQSGITLVSTLPFLAMRGKDVKTEAEVFRLLSAISNHYDEITQDDEKSAKDMVLELLEIEEGSRNEEETLEYDIQARMINHMSQDLNLAAQLKSAESIRFVASEVILQRGPHRVDIIGFNGTTLYFFELKKDRTTKVRQVRDYVEHYSGSELFRKLMSLYPMISVPSYKEIKGVMVMRYAESSIHHRRWRALEEENRIQIIFYQNSLVFHSAAS